MGCMDYNHGENRRRLVEQLIRTQLDFLDSVNGFDSLNHGLELAADANARIPCIGETKQMIKKMFNGEGLSVSPYDTAWVAMIPSFSSPELPHFPQCVNWLLNNQLHDGSWGFSHQDQYLLRDSMLSTLACLLALKRWGVGDNQINKGIQFIDLNFASSTDEKQHSPVGFDIIFPGMIEYAKDLNLDLSINSKDINAMICRRDLDIKRAYETKCEGREAYVSYVSEGLGKLHDWEIAMKYQKKNGSLFNSPSTTAAAAIHLQNHKCLNYLDSIVSTFGNAVPTIYPLDIYTRLWIVDNLEKLGIDRHFAEEISTALDETYEFWQQGEEDIFLDIETCAMAFRILRFHGYDVSSEPLRHFADKDLYFTSVSSHLKNMRAPLELFRASELTYPDESTLEKQLLWLSPFLNEELSNDFTHRIDAHIREEMDDTLKFPFHANLDRLRNKRIIGHYNVDDTRMLKASYRFFLGNKDLLDLAIEDFNMCLSVHSEEFIQLDRWVENNRLNELTFARKKLAYCYFSAAASLFPPHLSEARNSWTKNAVLTTLVDDFFDIGGSLEELVNLVSSFEKWDDDVNVGTNCCSEQVEIILSAVCNTIREIGNKSYAWQARNVRCHIVQIWLELMRSMLREAEWVRTKSLPKMDEYMSNGYVSFALGPIVLPTLYFIGPKLSEDVIRSIEFHNLFKLLSTCGRLLNDIRTFKRESEECKPNAIVLRMVDSNDNGVLKSEEQNVKEIMEMVDGARKELLRMVLESKGSVVPRACKDVFWKMSQVLHFFYSKDDAFTSQDLVNVVSELIHQPLS